MSNTLARVEYAKSGRAKCVACNACIEKDTVRFTSNVRHSRWYHENCFLGKYWSELTRGIENIENLRGDDQERVKETIVELGLCKDFAEKILEDKKCSKTETAEVEDFYIGYGKPGEETCSECNQQILRNQVGICKTLSHSKVAKDYQQLWHHIGCFARVREELGWLASGGNLPGFKSLLNDDQKTVTNALPMIKSNNDPSAQSAKLEKKDESEIDEENEDKLEGSKVISEPPPLYLFQFACIGLKVAEADLKKRIAKLGGKIDTNITDQTIAIFSTPEEVKKMGSRMMKAHELGIHVAPIEYLTAVEEDPTGGLRLIASTSICDWGTDPSTRVPQEEAKSTNSKSIYTKSVPKSIKWTDSLAVDPGSGLGGIAHVYVNDTDKYSVVLGLTDIQRNKNSFYKLQLLESDNENQFWVFRSWVGIGTTIDGTKLDSCPSIYEAFDLFKEHYLDKTGNNFESRDQFVKIPGRMYPIDVEFDEDPKVDLNAKHKVKSKLKQPVQDLVKLLFDVDTMKRTMLEFDLDMEKMPLGKLSQKQLSSAFEVLTEIVGLIQNAGNKTQFIDATNRFYTLIPHNFGVRSPPLLDTIKQVEDLSVMLDSLMEIECAYNLIKTEEADEDVNPIDMLYEQLKTTLEPLDRTSEEFSILEKYVENTHADTQKKLYELEIVDVFKVARQGEARRYKPFQKFPNRRLLWYGSRLTNFAGILSHGLKIAPPEAPATGYMFGKGIYFADMVSTSANSCLTNKQNPTGLMLLSEVALGNMFECTAAKCVTKLPRNKHSTFGKGRSMPDPRQLHFTEDDVEIPLGKYITNNKIKSSLLYNEFIVYDIAQVNIQYLLRMNFKHK